MPFTLSVNLLTVMLWLAPPLIYACAVDLSKAFDKVNHHVMFTKLMKRPVPIHLLELLENLFSGVTVMLNGVMCGRQLSTLTLVSGKALYSHHFCLPYI